MRSDSALRAARYPIPVLQERSESERWGETRRLSDTVESDFETASESSPCSLAALSEQPICTSHLGAFATASIIVHDQPCCLALRRIEECRQDHEKDRDVLRSTCVRTTLDSSDPYLSEAETLMAPLLSPPRSVSLHESQFA